MSAGVIDNLDLIMKQKFTNTFELLLESELYVNKTAQSVYNILKDGGQKYIKFNDFTFFVIVGKKQNFLSVKYKDNKAKIIKVKN